MRKSPISRATDRAKEFMGKVDNFMMKRMPKDFQEMHKKKPKKPKKPDGY